MSKYHRDRGADFEREIANYLTMELGRAVRRKLGQARDGGDDLQVGKFRLECKRRVTILVDKWLSQVERCALDHEVPIVIARSDRGEALAVLRLSDLTPLIRGELGDDR